MKKKNGIKITKIKNSWIYLSLKNNPLLELMLKDSSRSSDLQCMSLMIHEDIYWGHLKLQDRCKKMPRMQDFAPFTLELPPYPWPKKTPSFVRCAMSICYLVYVNLNANIIFSISMVYNFERGPLEEKFDQIWFHSIEWL